MGNLRNRQETLFQSRVRKDLEKLPNCYITKLQQMTKRGDPDFILCVNGRPVYMELKKDGKSKPTKLQNWKLLQARAAGAHAFAVHPDIWPIAFRFLQRLARSSRRQEMPLCLSQSLTENS